MRRDRSAVFALMVAGVWAGAAVGEDFEFSYVGNLINGTGSLVGAPSADGTFDLLSGELYVTEGLLGGAYALYPNPGAPGASYSPSGFFIYDNRVTPGSTDAVVNWYGLLFGANGTEINIYRDGPVGSYTFYAHSAEGNVVDTGSFSIEIADGTRARPGEPDDPPGPPDLPAPGAAALVCMGAAFLVKRQRRE